MTFTAPKPANVLPPASHLGGQLQVVNIGSPVSLIEAAHPDLFLTEASDARDWLVKTRYTADSYKNIHGHALIIAGSRGYSGAAALCANAAMRSGAGLVTVGSPASAQSAVAAVVMPEVMTTALAETDRGAVIDEAIAHAKSLAAKANVVPLDPDFQIRRTHAQLCESGGRERVDASCHRRGRIKLPRTLASINPRLSRLSPRSHTPSGGDVAAAGNQ